MRQLVISVILLATSAISAGAAGMDLVNLVFLVRFSDQTADRVTSIEDIERLMNSESVDDNSVWRYYHDTSFGALSWKSHIVATEYCDSHPRGYYCPQSASNPDGYSMILQGYMREQALIKDICNSFADDLTDAMLDGNKDWNIDNVMIIVAGNSDSSSSSLLWPHQNIMTWSQASINDCDVSSYLMVFDGLNGSNMLNAGVMCHEMMHGLGAYDLYSNGSLNPVGKWDLMSDNQLVPQGMTAYTRWQYGRKWGNWIPEIRTLETPGTYTLNPIYSESPDDVAYIIKPDPARQEYFMVEYRRKSGWDASVPSSGLICYRVNPDVSSNLSASKFELYIFRPDGSTSAKGNLDKANFNAAVRRTEFGTDDSYYPFYSDGTRADFALTSIGKAEESGIEFTLTLGNAGIGDSLADDLPLAYNAATGEIASAADADIEVFTTTGRRVAYAKGSVDISILPSGIYIAKAYTVNHSAKIIKFTK